MKIIKSKKIKETLLNVVLVVGGLFLVAALLHYGNNKSMDKDMMVSGGNNYEAPDYTEPVREEERNVNVVSPNRVNNQNPSVQASTDNVFEQSYGQVGGSSLLNGGNVQKQPVTNPNDLLPKGLSKNASLVNP